MEEGRGAGQGEVAARWRKMRGGGGVQGRAGVMRTFFPACQQLVKLVSS
jgi:hypothetical protein